MTGFEKHLLLYHGLKDAGKAVHTKVVGGGRDECDLIGAHSVACAAEDLAKCQLRVQCT